MNESITKAAQSVAQAVDDLKTALLQARGQARSYGLGPNERATVAYLSECLADALKLQSRLEMIAN